MTKIMLHPKRQLKVHAVSACVFLVVLCAATAHTAPADTQKVIWTPGDPPHTLVIALDGLPYAAMQGMYKDGHFGEFYPPSRMVSTFPSMTDVAFSQIFALQPPKGYQQVHYSYTKNRRIGGLGKELFRLQEFERRFHAAKNGKMHLLFLYVASNQVARSEMREVVKRFRAARDTPVFYGYIAGTDGIIHRQGREGLRKFMSYFAEKLADLRAEYRLRTGRELNVVLFSDHGNTLTKGKLIAAKKVLRQRGYRYGRRLRDARTAVSAVAGIVSYWALYTDLASAPAFAESLTDMAGVNVVLFRVPARPGDLAPGPVGVINQLGEARIHFDVARNRGRYEVIWGDPLEYGEVMARATKMGFVDSEGYVPQSALFSLTIGRKYPDAIRRGYHCFFGAVKHPATVVVSLRPGHEFSNRAVKGFAMLGERWGTHGGLEAAGSLGVYMRTDRPSEDIGASDMRDELDLRYLRLQPKRDNSVAMPEHSASTDF